MYWKARAGLSLRRSSGGDAMAPRISTDCRNMDEVRAEIDRIDTALVDLMAERLSYVDRASQLKSSATEALVPWRIEQVIEKVRAHACGAGMPPELAEVVWRQMIDWFVRYEEEKLSDVMDGTVQTQNGR